MPRRPSGNDGKSICHSQQGWQGIENTFSKEIKEQAKVTKGACRPVQFLQVQVCSVVFLFSSLLQAAYIHTCLIFWKVLCRYVGHYV